MRRKNKSLVAYKLLENFDVGTHVGFAYLRNHKPKRFRSNLVQSYIYIQCFPGKSIEC